MYATRISQQHGQGWIRRTQVQRLFKEIGDTKAWVIDWKLGMLWLWRWLGDLELCSEGCFPIVPLICSDQNRRLSTMWSGFDMLWHNYVQAISRKNCHEECFEALIPPICPTAAWLLQPTAFFRVLWTFCSTWPLCFWRWHVVRGHPGVSDIACHGGIPLGSPRFYGGLTSSAKSSFRAMRQHALVCYSMFWWSDYISTIYGIAWYTHYGYTLLYDTLRELCDIIW